MKAFIDISWPLQKGLTEYKDRKTFKVDHIKTYEKDGVGESLLSMHSHTGTHIDLPSHFLAHNDSVNMDALVGNCRVIDCSVIKEKITAKDLEKFSLQKEERILIKTSNSALAWNAPFDYDFVYITDDAAAFLVKKEIKSIGFDYLGIERNQPHHETHIQLLENNITIIEGLRLSAVKEGGYFLCCLPLAFSLLDGIPARALLFIA